MHNKAQAAMEFLMTYGWAILIAIAAIGALAYFGVLSPTEMLPERCKLPSGIACLDFKYDGAAIGMVIMNSAGFDMTNVSVSVAGAGCNTTNSEGSTKLKNGEEGTYKINCSPLPGDFKGDLTFSYTNKNTGMTHDKKGKIMLTIPKN